jgi:hypothetical protein
MDTIINLLPEQEKNELKNEEILKKIFIAFIFILISVFFLIFALFFLRFFFIAEIESLQKQIFQKEKKLESNIFQNFQRIIEEKNQDISKIQAFQKEQIYITPIFEKISPLVVSNSIYFTSFSYQKISKKVKAEKNAISETKSPDVIVSSKSQSDRANNTDTQTFVGQIHISGWAKSRQELFYFKKALEAEREFKEVYFSPDSWVKPTDIKFSLNFQTNEF